MNIVQGDGNSVFSHLATLVHSKPARESFIPTGVTGILCCPSGRIPGIKGLRLQEMRYENNNKTQVQP